ncbi:MAG: DUF1887 family CARF protein [Candidatus Sericytochromatia bacterium]
MKLMIGFSTEQNTVNLIPAVQLKANKFVIIETSKAEIDKWSNGLKTVLEERNIKVEKISLKKEQDNRIDEIYNLLIEKFKNSDEEIIWNIGGGQKTHQIAIWNTFKEINNPNHLVCYSNPITKKIEIWTCELKYKEIDINVNLNADEIFTTFGQKIDNKGTKIYEKGKEKKTPKVNDLFRFKEFRQYFFSLSGVSLEEKNSEIYTIQEIRNRLKSFVKDQDLIREISIKSKKNNGTNLENYSLSVKNEILKFISNNFNTNNPNDKEIELTDNEFINSLKELKYPHKNLKINYDLINLIVQRNRKTPANYFEEVLESRTKEILEKTDKTNYIFEAYSNFKTGDKKVEAEYDILLVTTRGTLIALDAKTFEVDKKDSDARYYNLTLAGGKYVDWIPVISYDSECIKFMSKSLKDLPKTLNDAKKKFFVISDEHEDNYEHEIDTFKIKMKLFKNFLKELQLNEK